MWRQSQANAVAQAQAAAWSVDALAVAAVVHAPTSDATDETLSETAAEEATKKTQFELESIVFAEKQAKAILDTAEAERQV
jgi:hypothetical protein